MAQYELLCQYKREAGILIKTFKIWNWKIKRLQYMKTELSGDTIQAVVLVQREGQRFV